MYQQHFFGSLSCPLALLPTALRDPNPPRAPCGTCRPNGMRDRFPAARCGLPTASYSDLARPWQRCAAQHTKSTRKGNLGSFCAQTKLNRLRAEELDRISPEPNAGLSSFSTQGLSTAALYNSCPKHKLTVRGAVNTRSTIMVEEK